MWFFKFLNKRSKVVDNKELYDKIHELVARNYIAYDDRHRKLFDRDLKRLLKL